MLISLLLFKTTLVQIMKLLIYFTLLELSDNLHILLTDRVIFEIIEFRGIVGEIKKIDSPFMLIIEFSDVLFNIKIMVSLSYDFISQLFFRLTCGPLVDIFLLNVHCLLMKLKLFLMRANSTVKISIACPQL